MAGKSITAKHLSRYFARGAGVSTYTAVSDQHATFDTQVIAATAAEAPHVLDGIPAARLLVLDDMGTALRDAAADEVTSAMLAL